MPTDSRTLLAVGLFGQSSQMGDRIESLLTRRRDFSARVSAFRVFASAIALLALGAAGSRAPSWIALAQPSPRAEFEVVSIKPHPNLERQELRFPGFMPGGRFQATIQL